jgi:hypothetical protein
MAQYDRTVWSRAAGIEEPRNELAHAALIRKAEAGLAEMVMPMHMQDRDGLAVRDLKDLSECATADAGTHVGVSDVVPIRHRMPCSAEEQQARVCQRRDAACEKSDSLSSERMAARQILVDLLEQCSKQSQADIHRRSLACSAKIWIQG